MKHVKLQRDRILPYPGEILVKIGDEVVSDDVVAKLDYVPGKVYKVPVASNLSLQYDKLASAVVVEEGQHVQKGDILAINNVFYEPYVSISPVEGVIGIISKYLGMLYIRDYIPLDSDAEDDVVYDLNEMFPDDKPHMIKQKILVRPGNMLSPSQVIYQMSSSKRVVNNVYGKVTSIDNNKIVIATIKINSDLLAYLSGKVIRTNDKDMITIEGEVYQLQGAYGLGSERQGELKVIKKDGLVNESDITEELRDKILFIPNGISLEALKKANKSCVRGVITNTMPFLDVKEFAGVDFVPGITGNESINTALILIKGFINQSIEKESIEFVSKYDGKWVVIRGTTHIRAGAIRPELLLCDRSEEIVEFENIDDEIEEGKMVEVKRSGLLHGKKGKLIKIHSKPHQLSSLINVLVATVEINGEEHIVPLTNLVPAGRIE
jgi:hypothetical protein